MIRCENITKSFDDKKVLRGITFEAGEALKRYKDL